MAGLIVDIGTGDGKFAYELTKTNPDKLVVALDPNHKSMQKFSLKANRKPTKGGLQNLVFGLASLENLPAELTGKVNQVFINFPWAGLLTKLLAVDADAWAQIKTICQPGAPIDILFSTSPKDPLKQIDKAALGRKLAELNLNIEDSQAVSPEILKRYPSSWAKRLAFGKDRNFHYMRIQNGRIAAG